MGFEKNGIEPVVTGCGTSGKEPDVSAEFSGPIENRECRDVIFLLIFVLFLGGLGYVTWRSVSMGNPLRIVYGVDSWGNICNQDNDAIEGVVVNRTGLDLKSNRYLYYFNENIFDTAISAVSGNDDSIKICVRACPSSTISTVNDMTTLATTTDTRLCVYDVKITDYFSGNSNGLSNCPSLPVEPHDDFLLRCIPTSVSNRVNHIGDVIKSLFDVVDDNFIEKAASDLNNSWFEMTLLSGLAVVVGVVLTLFLQVFASIIVWVMVIAMVAGTLAATGACWYHYYTAKRDYNNTPDSDLTVQMKDSLRDWLIGSICVTVITVVILLIFLAVRKHIGLVVQLFKEAGRCIRDIPTLLLHPFMTVLILTGAIGSLILVFLFIETSGANVVDPGTGFVDYKLEENMKYYKWYHIFAVIWIVQFILACHQMAIAGAVATWFFTRDKSELTFPVMRSIGRLIRYHLGSLAFGSLVITIVVFMRVVLSFIENRIKGKTHPVAIFLLRCLKCCLWCFEKFLKFLNSNAYIEISIHGYSFCRAARQAFKVVLNNVIRLAVINYVGDFVLFLGKVASVAIVTVAGIELISTRTDIHYVWLPTVIAAIITYFISSCFMSVYEMTIDTIFLCFCEDALMNDGIDRPYYMSVNLMRCLSAKRGQSRGQSSGNFQGQPSNSQGQSRGQYEGQSRAQSRNQVGPVPVDT